MTDNIIKQTKRTHTRKRIILPLVCSLILLILCGGGFLIYLLRQTSDLLREFNELGFTETMQGHHLTITNPVTTPVLFMAESVSLSTSCSTNIAILAETAQIRGDIQGKLYFRGRVLTITTNGIIRNGLNIEAQTIRNDGILEGEIEGGFESSESSGESR